MASEIRKFEQLIAWQKAMRLVTEIYRASGAFPKHELFGLTSQLRRAAVSVPSNIAEGQCRSGSREFLQFLRIAQGSLGEVETQLMIASELNYFADEQAGQLLARAAEVGRLVRGLASAIERRIANRAQGTKGTSH